MLGTYLGHLSTPTQCNYIQVGENPEKDNQRDFKLKIASKKSYTCF